MLRRTAAKALGAAAVTAALGACSTNRAKAKPSAPAAGIPSGAPSAPLAVQVRDLQLNRGDDRPLPTRIWHPATGGPFPLIHFSHGLTTGPEYYADLLQYWARAGFVVAAPAFPHTSGGVADYEPGDVANQPADAASVITQTLAALGRLIAPGRIAAAGHSAGAATTIGEFTADRDNRLVAGVALAGEIFSPAPFAGPPAPMLFVHGRRDRTVAYQSGQAAYDEVPWPRAFLTITDGDHDYTSATFGVYSSTTTDFWRWSLYRDQAAKARLSTDADAGHRATLENRL